MGVKAFLWSTLFIAKNTNDGGERGREWPQALAIVISCLSALTSGLLTSWSSPFLLKITNDKVNYDITEEEASYFTIIHPAAMMVTCALFSTLCDSIGRKKTLLLITIPHLLSWILSAVARNVWMFYASRICAGIADGCMFAALPMYIGEVANPSVRGKWGNGMVTSMYLGEFLIHVIGTFLSVSQTAYVCIPITVLFFIFFCYMPESPYFYIMKGDDVKGKQSLKFLTRKPNVDDDYLSLKSDVMRQMSESGTWKDLFCIKTNRKALISAVFLRASQQLGGTSVFIMNTQFVFEKAKSVVSPEASSMIYLGLCLVMNLIVVVFVVDRLPRRFCYIASLSLSAIPLFILTLYFYVDQFYPNSGIGENNWIPIVAMVAYQIFNSFGMAVIPTLMLGELFSTSIKSKAMTVLMIDFGLMIFITNNILFNLNRYVGLFAPFLFFALSNVTSVVLSFYFIPETRGKTLEEIQLSLRKQTST